MRSATGFITLKEMPMEARPRERLFSRGPQAMSPSELIALLIGTGTHEISAVSLGEQILGRYDDLSHFATASVDELCTVPGVGAAKACKLVAAIELGRRLAGTESGRRINISDPVSAAGIFMAEMRHLEVEHLRVAVLDAKNNLIRCIDAVIGGLNIAIVRPRDILRHVLAANGASFIIAHNHPSGDPKASEQDIEMTRNMNAAADILGVCFYDHIIVGNGSFVSLKQEGLF